MTKVFLGTFIMMTASRRFPFQSRVFVRKTKLLLARQLLNVESEMQKNERDFRKEQSERPLIEHFGKGFSYLIQRLHCNLSDTCRVPQSETHAGMIRDIIMKMRQDLHHRGLTDLFRGIEFDRIIAGLEMLERRLQEPLPVSRSQHEFDLIYDGVRLEFGKS